MISDEERREVAARLRKAIGLTEFAEVLGFNWTDDSDWVWKDVSNLVADLIEPGERIAGEVCGIEGFGQGEPLPPVVDRDALLALADEIYSTSCDNTGELTVDLIDIWGWAQAICEAVGE